MSGSVRSIRLHLAVSLVLWAGMAVPAKTIMWLGNFFQQGAFSNNASPSTVDSVWVQRTDSSGNQGYYFGARNLQLVKTTAYVDQALAQSPLISWWSIPNWSPNLLRNGTLRLTLSYKMVYGANGAPQVVRNETQEMNGRYSAMPDLVDSCVSAFPSDTIWMYFDLGQWGNSQSRPRCTDHNPYLKLYGTIHLLNPWPGRMAYVSWNGKWQPLYAESGRPGWVVASFHGLPTLNPTQKLTFASSDPSSGAAGIQYMDMTGIGAANTASPWDFSSLATPWERWIAPPVDGTNLPKLLTSKPAKATTLMIRRPTWSASALRVTWKGVPGRFIAQSTSYCEWFAVTFYAGLVPSSILLNHPFQDTVFGANGLEPAPLDYSTYTNWITVGATASDTLWLNTLGTQKSPSTTRPAQSEITVCGDKILAFQVYDYKLPGPYFPFSEKTNSDMIKGLVGNTLGADGLPTYTGKSMCGNGDPRSTECTNPANGPDKWFRKNAYNTTGCLLQPLKLNSTTGKYEFSSSDYFPLDTLIKDPAFNEKLPPSQTQSHDFGFCMHAKSTFEYVPGLSFSFRGDDDVWVFIDKKLALDLGGQHGPIAGDINLDKLGLLEGRAYQFDMFYCERHTPGSNIMIQTTMNLVPSYDFRFDSTVVSGTNALRIDLSYIKTEIDGSKCQDDTKQTPVPGKGLFFLQYPDGRTLPIPEPPAASGLSGVAIAADLASIQVDLAQIKKDPNLTQRGWYKIVIRFQNDPSQANVKEIPFQIDRGPVDLTADLFDTDGDGRADSLVLHAPDTIFKAPDLKNIRAVWARSNGARDSVVVGSGAVRVLPGDTVAVVDWPASPFQKRSTCPLGGCVAMGLATTLPYLPDSVRNLVKVFRERIAPFADSARVSFGVGAAWDTLRVWTSEAGVASAVFPTGPWALVGTRLAPREVPAPAAQNPLPLQADPRQMVFLLPPGADLRSGDSLRLGSRYADASGNSSVGSNVWVPIRFGNQPVRAIARDRDGDGQVDSMEIRLTRSSAGTPDGTGLGMVWNGVQAVAAGFARSADLLSWRGSIGPFALGTAASPGDAGWLANGSDALTFRAAVEDSVPPVAIRARLVFGADPGSWDTLEITGSEPLAYHDRNLAMVADVPGVAPVAVASANPTVLGSVLRIPVPSGTIPDNASWARLGQGVSDGASRVGSLSRWVPLEVVPAARAYLFDSDGDGRADSVHVAMRGSLPLAWMVVSWCDAAGEADARKWAVPGHSGAFGFKPSEPSGWFAKGATSCLRNPSVAFLDPNSNAVLARWPLVDRVAPMVVEARYGFGTAADTLQVRFSEPVAASLATPAWVEWKGDAASAVLHDPVSRLSADGTGATLVVRPGALADQWTDSVRMASGPAAGHLVDATGTPAGPASPFAPIQWGLPPLEAAVSDPAGQGRGTTVSVRLSRAVPAEAVAGIRNLSLRWNAEVRDVDFALLAPDASGGWKGPLALPFALGATDCGSDCGVSVVSRTGSVAAARLLDSVPPSLVGARYRYSRREVARDTLFATVSEPWVNLLPGNTLLPLVTAGSSDHPMEVDSVFSLIVLGDRDFALVVDTSWGERIHRGDSARLSFNGGLPLARDIPGNPVGMASRWVPIEFGQRPLELVIRQENPLLVNGVNGVPAWSEPPAGVPGLEILVRSDKGYVRVDDDLVRDPATGAVLGGNPPKNDPARTMGVYIKLNRPLEGTLFVYDNIGTSVLQEDLSKLKELWPESGEDLQQEIKLTWNGTDRNNRFAAGGIYLLRCFVKFRDKNGRSEHHNLLWKYGWVRPSH